MKTEGIAAPAGGPGGASRPRVGVLTFHRCFNYGSYWQARCLVEGLRELGHDAVLLDHESADVERAEARCLLQPALPARTPRRDFPALKAKGRKFIDAIAALPRSAPFPLLEPEQAERFATVVVGSDEVWNFQHPWYSYKRAFWGDGLAAGRLVSYAASFGNHAAAAGLDDWWADRLRGFHAVSVRDGNSSALVAQALDRAPALVLDPCLLFPKPALAVPPANLDGAALVYGHGFPDWLVEQMVAWRAATGTRLVSLGYRNDWADDQWLDAGPLDFARAMRGAAAVVTNFFHGCVFAFANGKPLVTAPSDYRQTKVHDLTAKLGATHRVVTAETDAATLATLLATPVEPAVEARIAALRAVSTEYLRAALG